MSKAEQEELDDGDNIGSDEEDDPFEEGEEEFVEEEGESEVEQTVDDPPEESKAGSETQSEPDEQKSHTLLYDILGVAPEATQEDIKKAYKKMALRHHPDKCRSQDEAEKQKSVENFQKLQKANSVLSNPKKRERYDQWGDDGTDTFNSKEWMNAYEYYRELHPEIEKKQVDDFLADYYGGEEERQDVLKFYKQMKGDVRGLLENIMGSENAGIDRYLKIIDDAIGIGAAESYPKLAQTRGKVKKLPEEQKEAEAEITKMQKAKDKRAKAEKGGTGNMDDLRALILNKQNRAFGNFLNYAEQKYGGDTSKKASKKRKDPPDTGGQDASKSKRRKI